jgi:hypothetical protein
MANPSGGYIAAIMFVLSRMPNRILQETPSQMFVNVSASMTDMFPCHQDVSIVSGCSATRVVGRIRS